MVFDFTRLPLRPLAVGWVLLTHNIDGYISRRQLKRVVAALDEPLPKALEDVVTVEEHHDAARYSKDKLEFARYEGWFQLMTSCLSYYYTPMLWDFAGQIVPVDGEFLRTITFLYLALWPLMTLSHFTFGVYTQFVIEEKHGFNKMTFQLYCMDYLKGQALGAAIGTPLLYLAIRVARWGGRQLYIYLWVFAVVVQLVLIAIIPVLVMPLFNKYEPLQDEALKTKIEALAGRLDFPLFKLEQMDGSKRSAHSNAFFYGLWKFKRIVLFDTLLHLPHEYILAVLGHELGHWKMNHTKFHLVWSFTMIFITFAVYGMVFDNPTIFEAFGYKDPEMSIAIGFLCFNELWQPIDLLTHKFFIYVSRVFEFQADRFATDLGFGAPLISALTALTKENKSFGDPDPVYSSWHYTHPSFVERRAAIKAAPTPTTEPAKPEKKTVSGKKGD